eukprot:m.765299 g.765299  ORF g.765299 m.765299 type:complete len:135 (-) comp23220_c1_seq27:499-903(-)
MWKLVFTMGILRQVPTTSTPSPPPTSAAPTVPAPTTLAPTNAPTGAHPVVDASTRVWFLDKDTMGSIPTVAWEAQGLAFDGKLYYFGGFDTRWRHMFKESYAYDAATDTWVRLTDVPLADNGQGTSHCGQVGRR